MKISRTLALICGIGLLAGCAGPRSKPALPSDGELRLTATQYIRAAARLPERPEVRAHAMEAIPEVMPREGRLLLREGLRDEHPAVRFAACMGLGLVQDRDAEAEIRNLLKDDDRSVRVAAYYALERLGDLSQRSAWRDILLHDRDAAVRRNAVTALGRLENPKTAALLWKAAAEDEDEGVRLQAMEALALLGDTQAISRLIHDAYGGLAFKQPFALLALGRVQDEQVLAALRTRLNGAPYIEARLAAARGLGMQGQDAGFDIAVKALTWNDPKADLPDDPPDVQIMRVRTMAAMALGDIGRREALDPLRQAMRNQSDPRVQVAAATAVLKVLQESPAELPALPPPPGLVPDTRPQ